MGNETKKELEKMLDELKDDNPRKAAEIAYALAFIYIGKGRNKRKAIHFAKESIRLFEQCEMKTLEQCGAIYNVLGNICIPDLVHENVVRFRFKEFYGINLN